MADCARPLFRRTRNHKSEGFLTQGVGWPLGVLLAGTGAIVTGEAALQAGGVVTITSSEFGELSNPAAMSV